METAAIILAAGASSRLGRPKQLVIWQNKPMLETVVRSVAAWPVDLVVVVLGAHADAIVAEVDFGRATVIINEDWEEGLASSLRVGLDLLTRMARLERVFIALGDQPTVPSHVPAGLLDAAAETPRPAIVPVYRYEQGNPVLFDRSLWPRLMTLTGDTGAAALLRTHPEWVKEVRFQDLPPRDIDTAADVADLTRGRGFTTGPRPE